MISTDIKDGLFGEKRFLLTVWYGIIQYLGNDALTRTWFNNFSKKPI